MYCTAIFSLKSEAYFWHINKNDMVFFRRLQTIYAIALFVITFLLLFPFLFLFAQRKNWHKYAYNITHLWGPFYFKLVGIKVKIEDRNANKWPRPCIYVANHFSYFDIASMPLIANDACFVGKQSIKKTPLFGYFFTSLHITVNRQSLRDRAKVFEKSIQAIEMGKSLFIFPEGGIQTTNPPQQVKYKDGAFRLAISTGVPLVPITLLSNWQLMPDDGKFLIRGNYINIVIHEAIETANLNEKDIHALRDQAFNIIQSELLSSNP